VSTDYFQNRATSFEATRRTLDAPGERERTRASLDTGSQPAVRPEAPVSRTLTWGTALKLSVAVYFALMAVLVTLALAALLVVRFAGDQVDDLKAEWQSLPATTSSSTMG